MRNPLLEKGKLYAVLSSLFLSLLIASGYSQTLTEEFVDNGYSLSNLGSAPDVPGSFGGLTIRPEEPNTLYLGGAANSAGAALYAVDLVRDPETGTITGFSGTATVFADTPNIDGGVTFTESGTLLFTQYNQNNLGQILPDDTYISTDLSQYGIASSVGSLGFVPDDFSGAGNLIFASFNGSSLFNVPYSISEDGEYLLSNQTGSVSVSTTAPGPEGIAYVPLASVGFPNPSIVISSFSGGKVVV